VLIKKLDMPLDRIKKTIGVRLLAKSIFPIGSFPKVRLSNLRGGSLQWGLSAVACPDKKKIPNIEKIYLKDAACAELRITYRKEFHERIFRIP